jgi:arylsulfatase A
VDAGSVRKRPPNFVVFFCDNLGYGDIEPTGSSLHRTPNLNRMAAEGCLFTHFYATAGVCTPSRASLMTGAYPRRVSMDETDGRVLRPVSPIGLHPDEITVARVLKDAGYATGIVGKWHLGDQPPFLPTRHGFDEYFGIPYSDDMVHTHPAGVRAGWPPLPLMRGERVIEAPAERNTLTRREAREAVRFIREHRDEPFFLYIPHSMPGSTNAPFASRRFRGRSRNGPWGDAVEELDWAAGQVLDTLDDLGLSEDTLVLWTSDNGAPRHDPPLGSNAPLHGWGYSTAEGGQRVPCIVRWPGHVPAGAECRELCTTMDVLPTFAALAGTHAPQDRILDGYDIRPLLFAKEGAQTPYSAFYYYEGPQLQAVRSGPWKLYLPLENWTRIPNPAITHGEPSLYNVEEDSGETHDVAGEHPQIIEQLSAFAETARDGLGDGDRPGRNQRPAGRVQDPVPLMRDGTPV